MIFSLDPILNLHTHKKLRHTQEIKSRAEHINIQTAYTNIIILCVLLKGSRGGSYSASLYCCILQKFQAFRRYKQYLLNVDYKSINFGQLIYSPVSIFFLNVLNFDIFFIYIKCVLLPVGTYSTIILVYQYQVSSIYLGFYYYYIIIRVPYRKR